MGFCSRAVDRGRTQPTAHPLHSGSSEVDQGFGAQAARRSDSGARPGRALPGSGNRDTRHQRKRVHFRRPVRADGRVHQILRGHRQGVDRGGAIGQQAVVGYPDSDDSEGRQRDLGDSQPRTGHRRHVHAVCPVTTSWNGRGANELARQPVVSPGPRRRAQALPGSPLC